MNIACDNECTSGLLDDIHLENNFGDGDFYDSSIAFDIHPICSDDFVSYCYFFNFVKKKVLSLVFIKEKKYTKR